LALPLQNAAYTVVASTLSVAIGLVLVNVSTRARASHRQRWHSSSLRDVRIEPPPRPPNPQPDRRRALPRNPLDSAVKVRLDGEMPPFMVFALIFGVALSLVARGRAGDHVLVGVLEQIFAVCMKIVDLAMTLAPFAVFAIIFNTAFRFGYEVFGSLFFYVATVVLGLLVQQFVVYSVLIKTIARRSPVAFFAACRDVYLYAFSTASSNATLPLALETAEQKLELPPNISRFALTVGATANQNGTAIFEGVTVLFLAQVYGIELTIAQQLRVMMMSIVAGIGTAGVPGGSLPMVMIVMQSVGIPVEGMGLILGVDRFLDMCRTTVNVSGDLVIAALVSGRPARAH
jgi:DAACS family dicarboxylate/amino acid:cation (Na+ or H+) symporter